MTFEEKIQTARDRIRKFINETGVNKTYVAFSGGKDSKAVLRLTRSVFPNCLVIHNGHKGEDAGKEEGVLFIKEPKAVYVPNFLETVSLQAQIDGTRRDEDKTVIFEGNEIHRSKMPTWRTENGVWGLRICFPLWDWTEDEVFQYLEYTNPIEVNGIKFSYEGEGDLIGTKTLFCQYPPCIEIGFGEPFSQSQFRLLSGDVDAVYITASKGIRRLDKIITELGKPVTVEVKQAYFWPLKSPNVRFFVVCDKWVPALPNLHNLWIKIRVRDPEEFDPALGLANDYADLGYKVLLMPEYINSSFTIGTQQIQQAFSRVHHGVRIMPPMQNLLGMD